MSHQTFLEPAHLLQTIVLAVSIFNMVAFFWLALTVWLNGDRHTWIARLGVVGLGLSALFFFLHALLISSPLPLSSNTSGVMTPDFLWHLIWIPALGVPYIWFAIGLHYAALINEGWRRRRPILLLSSGILGCVVLLLLILHQSTFTFVGTLRLLVSPDPLLDKREGIFSPPVLLPILFLCYVTFCAIGPWFTLGRMMRLLRVLWNAGTQFMRFRISWAIHLAGRIVTRSAEGVGKRESTHHPPDGVAAPQTKLRPLRRALVDAFWDDPTDIELLQEPDLSWHLARPGLLLAALLMVGLTTTLGLLCIQSLLNWLVGKQEAAITPPALHPPTLSVLPFHLFVLDLCATGAVALIILLIGYSIVRHGILIERPLARRGFFEQWRGIVIVATGVAIFIALLVTFTHSNLGGLLLITLLATVAYALFTWSSYTAHDHYIALLGPFLRSTSLPHWLNTDLRKTEQELEDLFFHLCQDVLAVQCARLDIIAGSVRRSFSYRWPEGAWIGETQRGRPLGTNPSFQRRYVPEPSQLANDAGASTAAQSGLPVPQVGLEQGVLSQSGTMQGEELPLHRTPLPPLQERRTVGVNAHRVQMTLNGQPMICWVCPIYDERGLIAKLYLGPRQDGGAFTDEDVDLAHACGQRILDALGDHEAMQAVADLLRRRIVDVKLLGAQQRRVLHDEILPQMHLALLELEILRSTLRKPEVDLVMSPPDSLPKGGYLPPSKSSTTIDESCLQDSLAQELDGGLQSSHDDSRTAEQALNEAVDMITNAHRRLAAMMRATAPGAPHRLERDGLMLAIHTMLEQDFQSAFDEVEWYVTNETAAYIDEMTPPAIAELIFAAVQEALRNAARHGRGSDVHRRLRLVLKASYSNGDHDEPQIEVLVADDGVGIASTSVSETTGTGGGLLTHSALLAIAGGSLTIKSTPGQGVTVRILLPIKSLR